MGSTAYSPMVFRSAIQQLPKRNQLLVRQFNRDAKEGFQTRTQRIAEKQTLREKIMAPAGPNGEQSSFLLRKVKLNLSIFSIAFALGKGAVAGASVLGLGALCFYGLGLGSGTSVLNNSL